MAFLDLQKAYDSVDRPTLWKKLERMGFGGSFLKSLKMMYQDDYVTTEVGGVTTRPVYLGRGLRQGCSLSPMLFALYLAGLGQELTLSTLGVKLFRRYVSAIFFAVSACWCNDLRVFRLWACCLDIKTYVSSLVISL
jgi:hypothetical protein